jgi:hypothetical protein
VGYYNGSLGWYLQKNAIGVPFPAREITYVTYDYYNEDYMNSSFLSLAVSVFMSRSGAFEVGGSSWTYPGFHTLYSSAMAGTGTYSSLGLHSCDATAYAHITYAMLRGLGTCPFSSCDVAIPPTPTPTGSPTPTATNTPEATATDIILGQVTATPSQYEDNCTLLNYSFNNGGDNWSTTGTAVQGAIIVNDTETFSQSVSLSASSYYLSLVASISNPGSSPNDGTLEFDYTITYPDTSSDMGTFSISEQYVFQNNNEIVFELPVTAQSGTHTFAFESNLVNITEARVLQVCLSSTSESENNLTSDNAYNGYQWKTCGDTISPPTDWLNIGAWILYLWNSLWKTIYCFIMPPINTILANMILWFTWFFYTVTGFLAWLFLELLPFLFAHIRNFWAILTNLLGILALGAFNGLSLLWDMLSLILGALWLALSSATLNFLWDVVGLYLILLKMFSILFGYLALIRSYIIAAGLQLTSFIGAYIIATPTQPPGIPDCVLLPLEHGICALYFVADNTLFAGAIGSLLIPIIVIFVDMMSMFYFIKLVGWIFRQFERTFEE